MERYSSYKDSGEKWLGEIPGHWEMVRNKSFFSERKKCVGDESQKYTLLSLTKKGVIVRNPDDGGKYPTDFNTYKIVKPGDFVFCLFDVDETPRTIGLAQDYGMITGAYTILRQNKMIDKYLLYYYLSIDNQKALKPLYTGLRKVVQTSTFMAMKICMPPLPEQRAIVTYLDRVTGDIDRAIEESQKMIDLLNERKQIIIQHAVTKGLNKNAKLKYSGVEWIGEVPEGWECLPLRRVAEVNPSRKKKLSSDSLVGYAPMECIRNDNMQPLTSVLSRLSTGLTYCETNDIVLAKVTPCFENGNVAIVPQVENNCCFASSEIFVYRCGNRIESRFLLYYFQNKGFIDAGASTMQGTGGLKRVTTDFAKNAIITLPSMEEQKEIIKYLDDYTTHIKSAIASAERKIALLRERKQIIINEVVTGKVKVS